MVCLLLWLLSPSCGCLLADVLLLHLCARAIRRHLVLHLVDHISNISMGGGRQLVSAQPRTAVVNKASNQFIRPGPS